MSDNPRPVLYGSGYETFLPRAPFAERHRTVTVVGKHCESGDVLVRDASVPDDLVVGDLLATPVTGAYGHSMGSNYNKVPRPAVVFVPRRRRPGWSSAARPRTISSASTCDRPTPDRLRAVGVARQGDHFRTQDREVRWPTGRPTSVPAP